MFGSKKRPWKKYAMIERTETNGGDVQFVARVHTKETVAMNQKPKITGTFESLTEAEAHLDNWWTSFWPSQVKSTRRA